MTTRPLDFIESEHEVHELLCRFVAQWRAGVGLRDPDRRALILCEALDRVATDIELLLPDPNEEPQVAALRRLADVLMELPSTDVWSDHAKEKKREEDEERLCRLHGTVRGANGVDYRGCDRLAWIGDKLLNAKYGLKNIWPEPGVWSSWFECDRSRH